MLYSMLACLYACMHSRYGDAAALGLVSSHCLMSPQDTVEAKGNDAEAKENIYSSLSILPPDVLSSSSKARFFLQCPVPSARSVAC